MTDKPKMPEPEVNGSVMHPELKICYTAPIHYTREQMETYAEAIQEWAYDQGFANGQRAAERSSHD